MQSSANVWQYIPLIKVDSDKGGELFSTLKISDNSMVSFVGLLDDKGDYKLGKVVEEANKKKPAERSEFDKEVLKVDERFNILYNVFTGNYLKIFPNSNDENNKWQSHAHHFEDYPRDDGEFAKSIIPIYFKDVNEKKWVAASKKLEYIKKFQDVLGKEIIPNRKRVEAELWYNQLNLNFWLFQVFFVLGTTLLVFSIVKIFTNNKITEAIWNISIILVLIYSKRNGFSWCSGAKSPLGFHQSSANLLNFSISEVSILVLLFSFIFCGYFLSCFANRYFSSK